jgi:nucleoside-diphosphate-sugar epimerase
LKILLLGSDGYIGYPLMRYLMSAGHLVVGVDNLWRRYTAYSVVSIKNRPNGYICADISKYDTAAEIVRNQKPDVIIHLAEQPSAAYSMSSYKRCRETHQNNIFGTLNVLFAMKEYCPESHLIKLGSMGEYGTPGYPIEEDEDFPKAPKSWYHCTKVHDTHNIRFACDNWGLNCTDIMQGVVYGLFAYGVSTRLDVDECFGTVINRFCAAAAMGIKLPVYGNGGQVRGFLPLEDSLQCIELIIKNPPNGYRVVNQFDKCYSMNQLAEMVLEVEPTAKISRNHNPRNETECFYEIQAEQLRNFGYKPKGKPLEIISDIISVCRVNRDRIAKVKNFYPSISWLK